MSKEMSINELLQVNESYKAPKKIMEILNNKNMRNSMFDDFVYHKKDLEYDWFQDYFQNEHADRKQKKQDFTPTCISDLLSKLTETEGNKIYDCCSGTGGITIRKWKDNKNKEYICEEMSDRAFPFLLFNLAIRNMNAIAIHNNVLEGKEKEVYKITRRDRYSDIDKIENYKYERYDCIISNPPYSANWSADQKFLNDERFSNYGKLAPKSKADYAFIQHMIYLLDDNGIMAVVLPHGVLFRGASEGIIRKYLIEERNYLDAVIGLPEKLFSDTSIPTCILIFKKRRISDNILFIDASKDFEPGKNQNKLRNEDVEKIINTYKERKEIEKYAHLATLEEIKENEYNLNIPRYVDTFEEEEEIDLEAVQEELEKIDKEDKKVTAELNKYLKELGLKEII